ncbi:MAG: glutathione S-transferase family protein [Luminiphilus sp.]|nr:glutathione S-transferase family protein [Luminiphilus sp.]
MRLKPVYSTDPNLVDAPLTEVPNQWAPQQGIHLYHFPLSLDSQKVRQCLEELGVQWQSHPILLSAHQQFSPSYVRINSRCVVPTLVIDGKVTTDTINILDLLAARFGAANQCFEISEVEREPVNYWVDKAAGLFIEALTYGHIDGIKKPFPLGNATDSGRSHQDKVDLLSGLIETYKKDPMLKAAYEKKRAVIEATKEAMVAPGQMSAIVDATRVELEDLAHQLASGQFADGGWLASDAFSLADVQWGAVLYRLQWVGLQPLLWEDDSIISAYAEKLFARPSFQTGVVQWSKVGRKVILPTVRYKLLKALGLKRDT